MWGRSAGMVVQSLVDGKMELKLSRETVGITLFTAVVTFLDRATSILF